MPDFKSKSMIHFKGWISIETIDIYGESTSNLLPEEISRIELLLTPLKSIDGQFFEIKRYGYEISLFLGGGHNHDNGYSDDILQLLENIAKIAPRSYGLVYVHLSEDETFWNEYIVYRLAKGKVTTEKDIYLSPCNPTIED